MKRYRVTFDIVLNDDASPGSWITEDIEYGLDEGEFIDNFEYTELIDQ